MVGVENVNGPTQCLDPIAQTTDHPYHPASNVVPNAPQRCTLLVKPVHTFDKPLNCRRGDSNHRLPLPTKAKTGCVTKSDCQRTPNPLALLAGFLFQSPAAVPENQTYFMSRRPASVPQTRRGGFDFYRSWKSANGTLFADPPESLDVGLCTRPQSMPSKLSRHGCLSVSLLVQAVRQRRDVEPRWISPFFY